MYVYVCICVYIYIYIGVYVYVFIYIERERETHITTRAPKATTSASSPSSWTSRAPPPWCTWRDEETTDVFYQSLTLWYYDQSYNYISTRTRSYTCYAML